MSERTLFYGCIGATAAAGGVAVLFFPPTRSFEWVGMGAVIGAGMGIWLYESVTNVRAVAGLFGWIGRRRRDRRLAALCVVLANRIPDTEKAMEYVEHGECGVALELLVDRCVAAHPDVCISAQELRTFRQLAEPMRLRQAWVDLLPLVDERERVWLPADTVRLAEACLRGGAWSERVRATLESIEAARRGQGGPAA